MSIVLAVHVLRDANEKDIGDALLYDANTPVLIEVIAKLLRVGCSTALPALEYLCTAQFAQDMREIAKDDRVSDPGTTRDLLARTVFALQGLVNTLDEA